MICYKELLLETKGYDKNGMNKINILTISNMTLEPFLYPWLDKKFCSEHISPVSKNIYFDEYKSQTSKEHISTSDIIVVWLNCRIMFSDYENKFYAHTADEEHYVTMVRCQTIKLIQYLKDISFAQILWISFEDFYSEYYHINGSQYSCGGLIDTLNLNIFRIIEKDAIMLDLKRIIALIGIERVFDKKMQYCWNYPYTHEMSFRMAEEILSQFQITCSRTKKCLVIDCDNVLWGGVLSEVNIHNIKLGEIGEGKCYKDFQRFLLSLYYMGVILTICSKNDLEDVLSVFRMHEEMLLKEEHISLFQVNWDNKAENISILSQKINIDFDAMVFIDDSPFEIETVKNFIPDITTILFDKYMDYDCFKTFYLNSNVDLQKVKQRNETYQRNEYRKIVESKFSSYDEFIETLDISITIQSANLIEYNRISELSQRTNKCTNGKRYTMSQLKTKTSNNRYSLFSVYVKDRFSDLGMVGAFGIENDKLDLFCLSCRALGRRIEENMIDFIQKEHPVYSFYFIQTRKNAELFDYLHHNIPKII